MEIIIGQIYVYKGKLFRVTRITEGSKRGQVVGTYVDESGAPIGLPIGIPGRKLQAR